MMSSLELFLISTKSPSKLTLKIIDKGLKIFEVFLEEGSEL